MQVEWGRVVCRIFPGYAPIWWQPWEYGFYGLATRSWQLPSGTGVPPVNQAQDARAPQNTSRTHEDAGPPVLTLRFLIPRRHLLDSTFHESQLNST